MTEQTQSLPPGGHDFLDELMECLEADPSTQTVTVHNLVVTGSSETGQTVVNNTGGTLVAGTLVYFSAYAATEDLPEVVVADADAGVVANAVLTQDILNGGEGQAAYYAVVENLNTLAYATDTVLWLSATAGAWTDVAPTGADQIKQRVGIVRVQSATVGVVRFFPGAMDLRGIGTSDVQDSAITSIKLASGIEMKTWLRSLDDQEVRWGDDDDFVGTFVSVSNRMDLESVAATAGGVDPETASLRFGSGARTVNDAAGSPDSGDVNLFSGSTDCTDGGGTGGDSGGITVASGDCASTAGTSGTSGDVIVESGASADADTGSLIVRSGAAATGNSGNVDLIPGTAGTVRGAVRVPVDDVARTFGAGDDITEQYVNGTNTGDYRSRNIVGLAAEGLTSNMNIQSGDRNLTDALGSPNTGDLTMESGASVVDNGAGAATGGDSGAVAVGSGDTNCDDAIGTGGDSGDVILSSGDADSNAGTSGDSGDVDIHSGFSDDAVSGDVTLATGTGATDAGDIIFYPGVGGINDGEVVVRDPVDGTKELTFDVAPVTAANRRTLAMADADVDLGASPDSFSIPAFGAWAWDGDGAETNGAGLVGTAPVLTDPGNAFAVVDDGGVQALLSVSGAEAGYTANWQVFPDVPVDNDACYFGNPIGFCELAFDLTQMQQYTGNAITWEYWNGAWAALTLSFDNTDTTAQDGLRTLQQDGALSLVPPADWTNTTVNGQDAFWIRARVSTQANMGANEAILNNQNHEVVTPGDAITAPWTGTLTDVHYANGAVALAGAGVQFIIMNYTTGISTTELVVGAAQRQDGWTGESLVLNIGDDLGVLNTSEAGANEPNNVLLHVRGTRVI